MRIVQVRVSFKKVKFTGVKFTGAGEDGVRTITAINRRYAARDDTSRTANA